MYKFYEYEFDYVYYKFVILLLSDLGISTWVIIDK